MDDDDSGSAGQKISKYNSGVAQIMRLDELWKDTHKHSRSGKLTLWNWDLDRVWTELAADIKEGDERLNEYEEFNIQIGALNQNLDERIKKKEITADDYRQKIYKILLSKEIFLRRLQNSVGKGTKLIDADEDDFE